MSLLYCHRLGNERDGLGHGVDRHGWGRGGLGYGLCERVGDVDKADGDVAVMAEQVVIERVADVCPGRV